MKRIAILLLSIWTVPYAKASDIVHASLGVDKFQQLGKVTFEQLMEMNRNGELEINQTQTTVELQFEKNSVNDSLISKLKSKGIVNIRDSVMGSDTEGGCKN